MSKGAFHQADLLDGRIRRLDARRLRQIEAVNSAFDADLLVMLQGAAPWLRKMVRAAVVNDAAKSHLAKELDAALEKLDPHERETDAPEPLELGAPPVPRMPRPPSRLLRPALDEQPQDGNDEWGLATPEPDPHRYPEPGEAATLLPSGEVVAAESAH